MLLAILGKQPKIADELVAKIANFHIVNALSKPYSFEI